MKRLIRNLAGKLGYRIVRDNPDQMGKDPLHDMRTFLHGDSPVVFDVGANVGQTIQAFRSRFPTCFIHSFEPGPATFKILSERTAGLKDVRLWNCALGSVSGKMRFLENSQSEMSSFLPLSELGWGEVTNETLVNVRTIDQFCEDERIEHIDILKSDTQGFELEVLKGAERTIRANRIGLIYFEIIFSDMYKDLPPFGDLYGYLTQNGFRLVSFYEFHYQRRLASWTDALFVHESYNRASRKTPHL
jgi:FkbM family methyltransferase